MFEKPDTLEEVFSSKLGTALSMENHTVNVLDSIVGHTLSKELCVLLRDHAVETHQHIRNVERCFMLLEEDPRTSRCSVIHAIEQDCGAAVRETEESLVDAATLPGGIRQDRRRPALTPSVIR